MTATQSAPAAAADWRASDAISRRGAEKDTPRIRSSGRTETSGTVGSRRPADRPAAAASAPAPMEPHPAETTMARTAAATTKPDPLAANLVVLIYTIYTIVPEGTENLNTLTAPRSPPHALTVSRTSSAPRRVQALSEPRAPSLLCA